MKKLVLLGLILGSIGVAQAQDLNNYFDVSAGVTSSTTPEGDKGTGYNLGVSYTSYQNSRVFLQPTIQYLTSGNQYGDKYAIGKLDIGYTHTLDNGITLSPKVGVGVYKAMYDEGSNYGIAYNAGLEVGITQKVAVDLGYNYLKGKQSGNHVDLYTVAVKYKF